MNGRYTKALDDLPVHFQHSPTNIPRGNSPQCNDRVRHPVVFGGLAGRTAPLNGQLRNLLHAS